MDLETENRLAAILLKEASELRRQAQKEGALAYLREPSVRCKPNSRFLTATVRGVQQANRVVEVNEMWRLRDKQIELDNRIRESRHRSSRNTRDKKILEPCRKKSRSSHEDEGTSPSLPSKTHSQQGFQPTEDEGLRDEEVEEFLNSRVKRGRGTVGSRMDETGPFPPHPGHASRLSADEGSKRTSLVLGPERPSFLKHMDSSDEEQARDKKKRCHKKHGSSKEKSRNKKGHKIKAKRH